MGIILWSIGIAGVVLSIIGNWVTFKKCGKEGWEAIIPYFNKYTEFKLFWKNNKFWIWLAGTLVMTISAIIAVVLFWNLIFSIMISYGSRSTSHVNYDFFLPSIIILGVLYLSCVILTKTLDCILYYNRIKSFGMHKGWLGLIIPSVIIWPTLLAIFNMVNAFGKSIYLKSSNVSVNNYVPNCYQMQQPLPQSQQYNNNQNIQLPVSQSVTKPSNISKINVQPQQSGEVISNNQDQSLQQNIQTDEKVNKKENISETQNDEENKQKNINKNKNDIEYQTSNKEFKEKFES